VTPASHVLDVTLHEYHVGTIANIPGDYNVFVFDKEFRNDPAAPVLSFKAFRDPISGQCRKSIRSTRTKLQPYFSNLLPEGHLRRYLAEHAGVKPIRDFPLLWVLGQDLPGALVVTDPEARAMPPRDDVNDEPPKTATGDALLRFSLAGVQLKFSATGDPSRGLTIPVQGMGGHWIVKMSDQRFQAVPENEYSMMTFARAVGIDVPPMGLVDPGSIAGMPSDVRHVSGKAYYIKRFDRGPSGERIHTEDFAQANQLYPDDKYRRFNFDLLAEQIAQQTGVEGALEFVRRLVFNIGIGNGDMHAKNWSFIYRDGRTPALTPAYDYLSTVVYVPSDDLGMNFLGSKSFTDVDDARITALARRAALPTKPVLTAAHETVEAMHHHWAALKRDLPMPAEHRDVVERHMRSVPLFAAPRVHHAPVRRRSDRAQ